MQNLVAGELSAGRPPLFAAIHLHGRHPPPLQLLLISQTFHSFQPSSLHQASSDLSSSSQPLAFSSTILPPPCPPLVFRHHQTSPLFVMMDRPVAIATTSSFYSSSTMLNKNTLEGFPIPPHPPVGQESPQTVPPLLTVLIEQGEVPSDTIDARGSKRPLAGIISCPVSNSFREQIRLFYSSTFLINDDVKIGFVGNL